MSFKKYEVLVAGFFNCGVLKVFLSIVVEYVFMIDEDPVVVMTWSVSYLLPTPVG
jgi:hypothetical protein